MYAPLALKSVYDKRVSSRHLLTFLRAPVSIVNPTTTGTLLKPQPHRRVVSGGVIGGVAALLAIVTIALAIWHRRRQSHGRTDFGSSFLRESTDPGTQVTVTPFSPIMLTLTEATPLAAGTQIDFQQRLSHRPSSPEDLLLPLRRVQSVPVGLSSKELARLRSHGLRSQPLDGAPPDLPLADTIGGDVWQARVTSPLSDITFRIFNLRNPDSISRINGPNSRYRHSLRLLVANFPHAVTPRKRKLPRRHVFPSPI